MCINYHAGGIIDWLGVLTTEILSGWHNLTLFFSFKWISWHNFFFPLLSIQIVSYFFRPIYDLLILVNKKITHYSKYEKKLHQNDDFHQQICIL